MNVKKVKTSKMTDPSGIPNCKVIMLGNSSVGKTSIVLRFYKSTFPEESQPTIGAAYISKIIDTEKGKINLNVWDTAGQERFKSIIPLYLRGSHAALFVCSPDEPSSINGLEKWKQILDKNSDGKVFGYVALNKCDILKEDSDFPVRVSNFAKMYGFKYFETSALKEKNIIELFNQIAEDASEIISFDVQQSNESLVAVRKEKNSSCC